MSILPLIYDDPAIFSYPSTRLTVFHNIDKAQVQACCHDLSPDHDNQRRVRKLCQHQRIWSQTPTVPKYQDLGSWKHTGSFHSSVLFQNCDCQGRETDQISVYKILLFHYKLCCHCLCHGVFQAGIYCYGFRHNLTWKYNIMYNN